jgi:alanyl-tRNA synthetase
LKKAVHSSRFVGYEANEVSDAKVVGIIARGHLCDKIDEVGPEHTIAVVLDKTPFYGEMGGQVGDTGEILGPDFHFEVTDTQADGGLTLHHGRLRQGEIRLGATVTARVDAARRQGIRRAHSATHLLHFALQKHLGKHAQQQGSKVDRDWLRFDFGNPTAVSPEELARIEDEVHAKVMEAAPIGWKNMPLAEARTTGAMMLFGEKYPDVVRVVSVGDFSKELCGGTHLDNSGQVGLLKIIGEESVAAGTRRITALTGPAALEHVRRNEAVLAKTAAVLKVPIDEVPGRVEGLLKDVRQLKKQSAAGAKVGAIAPDRLLAEAEEVAGAKVVVAEVPEAGAPQLRELIDQLRRKAAPIAVFLASRQDEGKVMLVAGMSRDLVQKGLDAVKWARPIAAFLGGSGGGRPDLAQAGGKDAERLPEALEQARAAIRGMLQA